MDTKDTYTIPSWNMGKLTKKIDSLNRRAAKLGQPMIRFEKVGERKVVAPGYEEQAEIMGADWCPKITVYDVRVEGEGPVIEGWKFLGTLDHISLPGAVIVRTVPGEEIPHEYHHADGSCDHCGKKRLRNETFVLENVETNDHMMVGRQCVRDFIGYDVRGMLTMLSYLRRFTDELSDEDEWFGGGGGRVDYSFDNDEVLAATAAVINDMGWTARSATDGPATADFVLNVFMPPKFGNDADRREHEAWVRKLDIKSDRWVKEATAAREWLKEQKTDNEYMHNLHAIDGAGAVPARLFGYWCSLVATYQRAMERLRLAEKEKKLNEHLGNVKDKIETEVSVVSVRSIDGYYNTVRLHKMVDEDGRALVWFANTDSGMVAGDKYRIKGTIKKHDEYNGWKQTVLTRVKVIEEIENAA